MAMTRERAYELLGLEEGAERAEIRSSYKRLALQWHPDKHAGSAYATEKFQEISAAYKKLTDDHNDEEEEDDMEILAFIRLLAQMQRQTTVFAFNGGFFIHRCCPEHEARPPPRYTTRRKMPKKPPFAAGAKKEPPEPQTRPTAEEVRRRMEEERKKAEEDEAQMEKRRSHNRRNTIQKRRKKARLAAEKKEKGADNGQESKDAKSGVVDEKENYDLSSGNSSGIGDDLGDIDRPTPAGQKDKGSCSWEKKKSTMDSDSGTSSPLVQDFAGSGARSGSQVRSFDRGTDSVAKSTGIATQQQFSCEVNGVGVAVSEHNDVSKKSDCSAVYAESSESASRASTTVGNERMNYGHFADSGDVQMKTKKKKKKAGKSVDEESDVNSERDTLPHASSVQFQPPSYDSFLQQGPTSVQADEMTSEKAEPNKQTAKGAPAQPGKPPKPADTKHAKSLGSERDHSSRVMNQMEQEQLLRKDEPIQPGKPRKPADAKHAKPTGSDCDWSGKFTSQTEREQQPVKNEPVQQGKPSKLADGKHAKAIGSDRERSSKVKSKTDENQPPVKASTASLSKLAKHDDKTTRLLSSSSSKKTSANSSPQPVKANVHPEVEEEDWDLGSAFAQGRTGVSVTQRSQKSSFGKKSSPPQATSASSHEDSEAQQPVAMKETIRPAIDTTEVIKTHFAQQAMDAAGQGDYKLALLCYTRAIDADCEDFVLYSNRSWCYERIGNYASALQDADVCIGLNPDWAKGHARRGQALAGLKKWKEAEEAFEVVIGLDPAFFGIQEEIQRMKVQQLLDMGFSLKRSRLAIQHNPRLSDAIETLLNDDFGGIPDNDGPAARASFKSQAYPVETQAPPPSVPSAATPGWAEKPNPKSGICSLWVGNVNTAEVSRRDVAVLFARCGEVESVSLLPSKRCAFVNYSTAEAAAHALRVLQGQHLAGFDLVLRYPDSAARKSSAGGAPPSGGFGHAQTAASGRECPHWRGRGCALGAKCRSLHVPEHKGIDHQPHW